MVEHNLDVLFAHADWVIDFGPGAGHDGGRVVFEGIPSELLRTEGRAPPSHLACGECRITVSVRPPCGFTATYV